MKMNREVWIRFNNVGFPAQSETKQYRLDHGLKWIIEKLSEATLNHRIEISIAKNRDDLNKDSKSSAGSAVEDLLGLIDSLGDDSPINSGEMNQELSITDFDFDNEEPSMESI
jgi:hypothetical protein